MTLLLILLLNVLTLPQVAPEPVVSVELTLRTRGVYKSIVVTAQQTQVDINGQHRQQPTPPRQWTAILKSLRDVELDQISSLPVDVSRSAVDAALSAQIHITTAMHTYQSAPYDHPNAPAVLGSLVGMVVACAPPTVQKEFR